MTPQEKKAEAFAILAELSPGSANHWTIATTRLYEITLRDIPVDILYDAVLLCAQKDRFRPSPSDLRDAAHEITHKAQMNATEAHTAVVELICKYGSNAAPWLNDDGTVRPWMRRPGPPVELDDLPNAVRKTIDSFGGWIAICELDTPSSVFRAQFLKAYEGFTVSRADIDTRAAQRRFESQHAKVIGEPVKKLENKK